MPIQAILHDGTIINFPDGTTDEEMDRTVRERLAGRTPEVARTARLTPVEGNPFEPSKSEPRLVPVEGNPFEQQRSVTPPERQYEGFADDLRRGLSVVGTTLDMVPLGLEEGARTLVGDDAVDNINRFSAEWLGTHPGGAVGTYADSIEFQNSIPQNPDLSAAIAEASQADGFVSSLGTLFGEIAQDPSIIPHLFAEMAPSMAVGGGTGLAARAAAAPVVGRLGQSIAFGGGFNAGQVAANTGGNIAALVEEGMPLDEATRTGLLQTAGEIPASLAAGAMLPFSPFAIARAPL